MGETTQFIVREMKTEDAKEAAAVCKKCFGKHGAPRRKFLEDAAWSWRHRFFVAEVDGKIAACAGARVAEFYEDYYEAEKKNAYVEIVAVDPNYHGRGIGTELFTKLIDTLADIGVKSVYLNVHPANTPAIEFYKRFGFKYMSLPEEYPEQAAMYLMVERQWTRNSPSEQ